MKGTGAKRNVCPGSCVSTGAKFPVASVESAPMRTIRRSVTLDRTEVMDIGRKSAFSLGLGIFGTGQMEATFH